MLPLEGIVVVALEHAIAAPFCTRAARRPRLPCDQGRAAGRRDFARGYDERVEGLASHFVWTNRSKESLNAGPQHPRAVEVLKTAARSRRRAGAEPGATAAGAARTLVRLCTPRIPGLVVCDNSGYGDDPERPGPYRDKKAYDLLIQSESGFLSVTGTPGRSRSKARAARAPTSPPACYAYSEQFWRAPSPAARSGDGQGGSTSSHAVERQWSEWDGLTRCTSAHAWRREPPPRAGAAHATNYSLRPHSPARRWNGR
jgi:crotonobetainyl-CoA:carnitine CoA-transferase CaiB-like acyl-CoA transferase